MQRITNAGLFSATALDTAGWGDRVCQQNDQRMSHPLNHFFEPVGKVIVVFNQIEVMLTIFAAGMCLAEYHAVSALMAEASFKRKLDGLKCIADQKVTDPVLKAKFEQLLER